MEKEITKEQIIAYVFENTNIQSMNAFVGDHNLHALFYKYKNHLVHTFFESKDMQFSIFIADIINWYFPAKNQLRCNELSYIINKKAYEIKLRKRYDKKCQKLALMIVEHNILVREYNELTVGLNKFVDEYKKFVKQKEKQLQ